MKTLSLASSIYPYFTFILSCFIYLSDMIDSWFWGVGSGDADYLGWAGTVEKKCKCQWNCLLHLPRTKKVAYYKRLIQDRELRRPWGPAMKATGIHTAEPSILNRTNYYFSFFVAFDLKLITNNWYKGQKLKV